MFCAENAYICAVIDFYSAVMDRRHAVMGGM